jgi:DNA-binding MarR family transcriptional regulator
VVASSQGSVPPSLSDLDGVDSASAALADDLLDAMSAVRRTTRRRAGRPWVLKSMTGAQLELVRAVRRDPGVSVAGAAEALQLAPNTVSTLVRQLSEAGVVRRRADVADRRIVHLELSPRARQEVEMWRDRRSAAVARALERLAPEERAVIGQAAGILDGLAAVVAELPETDDDPGPARDEEGR